MTAFEFVLLCAWVSVLVSDKTDDLHRSNWKGYLNESNCPGYLLNTARFMCNPKKASRKTKKNPHGQDREDTQR